MEQNCGTICQHLTFTSLEEYQHNYLANAVFHLKCAWETIVKRKIRELYNMYETAWHERLTTDDDFGRLRTEHADLSILLDISLAIFT